MSCVGGGATVKVAATVQVAGRGGHCESGGRCTSGGWCDHCSSGRPLYKWLSVRFRAVSWIEGCDGVCVVLCYLSKWRSCVT